MSHLAGLRRVGAAIPVPLHHDHGPVIGVDDGPEVRPEGPSAPSFRGKFAPRNRPVTNPSQRPSARKNICCQPPSRPTAQLSVSVVKLFGPTVLRRIPAIVATLAS